MGRFHSAVGSYFSPSSAGAKVVTGLGFQPKGILFFGQNIHISLVPSFANFNYWTAGLTDGTTHVAQTSISFDANATTDVNQGVDTAAVVLAQMTNGVVQHRAELDSFDVDGFTLDYTSVASGDSRHVNFLALGGDDVSVKVGSFNANTATGPQAITGLGFRPTGVIFVVLQNAPPSAEDRLTYPAMGWADRDGHQGASCVFSENGAGATNSKRYQRTNKCIALLHPTTGAVIGEAGMTSLDADGFTINLTTAPASALKVYYFAFTGIPFQCGALTQPATSVPQSIDVGFDPGAMLFQSVNAAASASVGTGNDFSLGGFWAPGDGKLASTSSRSTWMADKHGADPVEAARYYSHAEVYAAGTVAAAGEDSTLASKAVLASVDHDGATLNWTSDGTQRELLWAAWQSTRAHRNLVSGKDHEVIGNDNVVSGSGNVIIGHKSKAVGQGATVKGRRSVLINLDGTPRTLEADDTFSVYGNAASQYDLSGVGDPEGAVSAPVGATYRDIVNGYRYTKATGSGDVGWQMDLFTKSVFLSNDDLKTLSDTPIELVAAPGVNRRIKPIAATFQYSVVSGFYTNINTTYAALQISWDSAGGAWAMLPIVNDSTITPAIDALSRALGTSIHDGMIDMIAPYLQTKGAWWLPVPEVTQGFGAQENKSLVLSIDNNGSGDLTGGHADDFARVQLTFRIERTAA